MPTACAVLVTGPGLRLANWGMPEISRFLGIVIRMHFLDHAPPHFHAHYGGRKASVRISPPEILAGTLPPRVLALVQEWATLHEAELQANWRRLQTEVPPARIAPLE
jgi:hypothetical protein